jgi:hypothetical protein
VTSQGTAHGRFTRAIERRQLRGAEMAARELGRLSPADALALVLLILEQAPHRSERAAARWVSLFLETAGPMTPADIELTVVPLGALMAGRHRRPPCSRRSQRRTGSRTSQAYCELAVRLSTVASFALIDSRIERREFGQGDLFLTREEADSALAEVLRDEPQLEPFVSVEALPLPEPSPN